MANAHLATHGRMSGYFRLPSLLFARHSVSFLFRTSTNTILWDATKLIFIYERGSGVRFVWLAWKYTSLPRARMRAYARERGTKVFAEKLRAVGSSVPRETFDAPERNRTFHCYFCTFLSDDMVDAQPPSPHRMYGANKTATSGEVTVTVFSALWRP